METLGPARAGPFFVALTSSAHGEREGREKSRPDQGIEFAARDAQIWCIEMGLQ
jgi:hypothetical protein